MLKPLISVIIPCYNVEKTILETLESVVDQTYPNVEIIAVEDGSTDHTVKILSEAKDKYNLIVVYQDGNKGLPYTRNTGFLQSKGEYVLFLDGDDKLHPDYLEACYSEFEKDPDAALVYTDTEFFEAKTGLFILFPYSYKQLLKTNCMPATSLMKSAYFKAVGMYDTNLKFAEDWELWIRYLRAYPKVIKVNQVLFYYRRRHSKDSMTDLNAVNNVSAHAVLYIYNKHYDIYKEYGYGMDVIMESLETYDKYKKKYYNTWYRKLIYVLFKPSKYKRLFEED